MENLNAANDRLFDLQADPGEKRNVIKEHPEVAARLKAALDAAKANKDIRLIQRSTVPFWLEMPGWEKPTSPFHDVRILSSRCGRGRDDRASYNRWRAVASGPICDDASMPLPTLSFETAAFSFSAKAS